MKTDKHFFVIFSVQPQWLFELTGLESPGECVFESKTFKALEQRPDGVFIPKDESFPITIVETQFQPDNRIYGRIVIEMALAQDEFIGRSVQGAILFRSRDMDPQTQPWVRVVHSYYLDELLHSLAERSPMHPLVAVFRPVFDEPKNLEAHAGDYYHQIRTSELNEGVKESLLEVFVSWLEQRFKDKGRKEIEMLLLGELPDLRETKSGRELFELGCEEGREEGRAEGTIDTMRTMLRCLIETTFGSLPADVEARIRTLSALDQGSEVLKQIPKIRSLNELKWPQTADQN